MVLSFLGPPVIDEVRECIQLSLQLRQTAYFRWNSATANHETPLTLTVYRFQAQELFAEFVTVFDNTTTEDVRGWNHRTQPFAVQLSVCHRKMDNRKLNKRTYVKTSTLPVMQEALQNIGTAIIFSILVLKARYWQSPMHPNAAFPFVTSSDMFR